MADIHVLGVLREYHLTLIDNPLRRYKNCFPSLKNEETRAAKV